MADCGSVYRLAGCSVLPSVDNPGYGGGGCVV